MTVILRPGVLVPFEAWEFLHACESAGIHLTLNAQQSVEVRITRGRLCANRRAGLARWLPDIRTILNHPPAKG